MSRLIFRIHHICNDRSALVVLGSLPEFGEWNVTKGLRANQHPEGTWETEVLLVPGQRLEFKWVVLFADGQVKWEDRSNRYIITPMFDTVYTAVWNGDMEISEIKSTCNGGSVLRNRKRDARVVACNHNKAVLGTTDDQASETSEIDEVYDTSAAEMPSQDSQIHVSLSQYSQTSVTSDENNLSWSLVNHNAPEEINETGNSGTTLRRSLKKTSSILEEMRANKERESAKYGSIITVICDLLLLSSFVFILTIVCALVFSVNEND